MDFVFKITTTGRKVLAAVIDGKGGKDGKSGLEITRVAVGKGRVSEDEELADRHELVSYVAEASIGNRRHSGERLYLSARYSNVDHPEVPTFYLSEFMIYARDPDSGREVDLIYATLGDMTQPMPAYEADMPPVLVDLPLTIVLSSDVSVTISAPAGLVTYDELVELQRQVNVVIPKTDWEADEDTGGDYPWHFDIALEKVTTRTFPQAVVQPVSGKTAWDCGLAPFAQGIAGAVRVYARSVPAEAISMSMMLFSNPPYVRGDGSSDAGLAGVGLSLRNGKLNVNVGAGMSVDERNNVQVDRETVLTDDDLLNEDETEQDVKDILLR